MPLDATPTFSRRRLLALAGAGAAAAAAPALPRARAAATTSSAITADASCEADTAEQELGPFYVADGVVRSDVTAGEDGVPLTWTITVTDSDGCTPLVGAAVDVWSANALGVYSDEASQGTTGETFLRGVQITDSDGRVTFRTIFPGWYAGRTNHIHLRVYTGGTVSGTTYSYTGATLVYTGQMFFDATINDAIATTAPYSSNTTARTLNAADRVYTQQAGSARVITLTGSATDGYTGTPPVLVVDGSGSGTTSGTSTSLTLNVSATSVTAGSKLTLSGVLRDSSGAGIADQDVTITATLGNGTSYAKVVETDSTGAWTMHGEPLATATYKARYAGSDTYAASSSTATKVAVHYRVAITDVSATAPAAKAIRLTGRVTPARRGVTVTVHRVAANGARRKLATATTRANGRWSARWHMAKGKHTVIATAGRDKYDGAGTSRAITIHRT